MSRGISVRSFFQSLRGKLILTYTLVTVLALLALEVILLGVITLFSSQVSVDSQEYLSDVISTLSPQARNYLQSGEEGLPGLQTWLEGVYASGYASLPPQYLFDSPAAPIVTSDPMYVLSPEGKVLAQAPLGENNLVGREYTPPDFPGSQEIFQQAKQGELRPELLHTSTTYGNYLMAIPVTQAGQGSPVIGVIVLTVKPEPPLLATIRPNLARLWPTLVLGSLGVLATGVILLAAVAPFGALFGFIMSRSLTRRLAALTAAADAWSEGNFQLLPQDRSKDEISHLGRRMRHMAERIQNLLQTQQELAALEERNRLARELHDTVKQQTFATLMQVRAARNLLSNDPETACQHLNEAEALIKTSQQDLGLMIAELRPAALDGRGLAGALQSYVDTWTQHTRIPVDFQVFNERSLPLEMQQALYRVVQEALANVARHSRASAAAVHLSYAADQVTLEVSDNGVGFDPQASGAGGVGLSSMRERLATLGGELKLESSPESGTRLAATAPVKKNGTRMNVVLR